MDIYKNLNDMIEFIEDNLKDNVDYKKLAKIVGVNEYTIGRIFPVLFGITLGEYVRKRRLTLAGRDLAQYNLKVMDVAVSYGWSNATAFSRAFFSFHGIRPSEVKGNAGKLKFYPKIKLEVPKISQEITYEIIEMNELKLYGLGVKTDDAHIKKDAPNFFKEMVSKYNTLRHPDYGMVVYEQRFYSDNYEYWVLWNEKIEGFKEWVIPKSKWLKFHIPSSEAKDIQDMSDLFYYQFITTCNYNLREIPELEYYHDGVTEFLVAIN